MDIKDLMGAFDAHGESLKEMADVTKKNTQQMREFSNRLQDLEQKGIPHPIDRGAGGENGGDTAHAIATAIEESDGFKALQSGSVKSMRMQLPVGTLNMKTAIFNATGSAAVLAEAHRVQTPVFATPRRLTIRNLLPSLPTEMASVEFTRELAFTNNAGPQYDASPGTREGAAKNESGISFELATARVETIAHWIPASRQILDDASQLEAYISNRLLYGLALEEEDEILNGDGTGGNLNGLWNQATTYNRGATGDTKLETLRKAITQLQIGDNTPTGIVLNSADWEGIELLKDTTGQFLHIVVSNNGVPTTWRLPVIPTNSMTEGRFMVADFNAAQIWDRQQAAVQVSLEHADYFVRNMAAILCEERVALTVYKPAAFIKGQFV